MQGPRCADSSSAGLARASAIFPAWQQSRAGVKLCKPSPKDPIPKKLRSVVRFAFHQIVLANSIQNLHSDSRLTDAIDDDSRNHFRTPISGTTRLARRAAVHQYGDSQHGLAMAIGLQVERSIHRPAAWSSAAAPSPAVWTSLLRRARAASMDSAIALRSAGGRKGKAWADWCGGPCIRWAR